MKALKTFLKKSLILLLVIALNHLNAVAMVVDNPTQNAWNGAKRAWDESKWAKHLATITERIKLAQDTLDRANQTLNSINKVNDVLNKTNQYSNRQYFKYPQSHAVCRKNPKFCQTSSS